MAVTALQVARTVDLTDSEQECGDTALGVVRRAFKQLAPGQLLEVQATVAEHAFVVRAWTRKTGKSIVEDRTEGNRTYIVVQQAEDA